MLASMRTSPMHTRPGAPILEERQSFPGVKPFQSRSFVYPSFKAYCDETFGELSWTATPTDESYNARHRTERHDSSDLPVPRNFGFVPTDSVILGPSHMKNPELLKVTHS